MSDPIPMRLPCPACNALHIDEGEFATKVHHTHSCQSCGMTWRPAVVATVGVRFLPGFKNADARYCPKCACHGVATASPDLDELDAIDAAMTPGPWQMHGYSAEVMGPDGSLTSDDHIDDLVARCDHGASRVQGGTVQGYADAHGIVAMRNTHVAIRAELRAARAENAELRDLLVRSAAVARAEGLASAERDNAREWLSRVSTALGVHRATAEDESITESWAAIGAACVTEVDRLRSGIVGGVDVVLCAKE
jgi:hypothetical protein